ncbi:EAL domain-containing protein [Comamonas nitrativorans]|uniref:EAL domain-containing protein n=1 Tax=Comamonas nitrativorans TaxID=108437 RepID=A0ABV9GWJ9_9BURK
MPPPTPLAIVIRCTDPQQLQDIFGPHIARQALQHLGHAVTALLQRLLGQFAPLAHLRRDPQGLWATLFTERPSALPRSPQEVCASLEAAGQHLLLQAIHEVFGAGTGMRLTCTVEVRPLGQAAWDAWLAQGTPGPTGWPQPAADVPPRLSPQAQDAVDHEASAARQIQAFLHDGPALRTLLQPIVRMADRRTVGYEALTRGPVNSPLERPDQLFAAAQACGQTVALELHCAALALQRTAGRLPPGQYLTLNLGPQALQHWAQQPQCLPLHGHTNVVVELTEHLPLDQAQALHQGLAHLRRQGLRLALDDTGCGFADLATAQALRPDIVKLCITVVQHATLGTAARAELQQAVAQLHAWGCQVLAEGIETEAQHTALHSYDIALAQGWLYGKPCAWERVLSA